MIFILKMISVAERKIHLLVYNHLNSLRKTSKYTNVSKSSLSRWKKEGGLLPKYNLTKNKNKNIELISHIIKIIIETYPLSTINDIVKIMKEKYKIPWSYGLVRIIIIKELKFSYKKIKYANYCNENTLKDKTNTFCSQFKTLYNSNNLIACIDEVGFNSRIVPIHSWSLKGEATRVKNKLETGNKSKNKSICCCITSKGKIIYNQQTTPYNTDSFLLFLKQTNLPQNTLLLIDNVSFHHSKEVKQYIKNKKWNILYTPPYSPWFNPIENIFGIIKHNFRKNKMIKESFESITGTTIIKTITSTINKILSDKYLL